MLHRFALKGVICTIVVVYCSGKPSERIPIPAKKPDDSATENLGNNAISQSQALQNLFGLLNKTVVQSLVMDHYNVTQGSLPTDKFQHLLSLTRPLNQQPASNVSENRFQESGSSTQPPRVSAQPSTTSNTPGVTSISSSSQSPLVGFSNGRPGTLIPPGKPLPAQFPGGQQTIEDRLQDTFTPSLISQKPLLPGQLRPQGSGLLQTSSENRNQNAVTTSSQSSLSTSKSPLEYNPNKPFFAGQFSSGYPNQLIPSGNPLPAGPTSTQQTVEDRLQDIATPSSPSVTASTPLPSSLSTSKSPLVYNPNKPFFAGQFSSGYPNQLIPPGNPLPAGPTSTQQILEDRLQDAATSSAPFVTTNTSPLEYNPNKPFFAGQFSSGRPSQLIPPGSPLPAGPPQQIFEGRFQDGATSSSPSFVTTSQSPLEYNSQGPSFAGQFFGGRPGQLIPSGRPLPADPTSTQHEDRFQSSQSPQSTITNTRSPIEYNPQRPSFTGQVSSGFVGGQPTPSGNPLPASTPINGQSLEDRFQAPTAPTIQYLTTSSKPPLEYNNQRPFFAGQTSGGRPGQLIPSGEPWPVNPPNVQNRFPQVQSQNQYPSQSPDYDRRRQYFPNQFSNGRPGQFVPPGKPWPANPPRTNSGDQNRFSGTSSKNSRRGSLPGQFANGGPDQLVPADGSWPANPLDVFDYSYF